MCNDLAEAMKALDGKKRWVLTQKTADIARCRIVVKDFATGGADLSLLTCESLQPKV